MKVQYPGADEALRSDLRQLSRMSRIMQPLVPGLEIKPLIAELQDRMAEELDYRDEADHQRAFAAAYDGDERVRVPKEVAKGRWTRAWVAYARQLHDQSDLPAGGFGIAGRAVRRGRHAPRGKGKQVECSHAYCPVC